METNGRRQFMQKVLGFVTMAGVRLYPLYGLVGSAYANAQNLLKGIKPPDPGNSVTPLNRFQTMGTVHYDADIRTWRLEISGNIKHPLKLTYQEIIGLPAIEKKVDLVCPGFFINHGIWKGVSIKPLLDRAVAADNAAKVIVSGHDGDLTKKETFPLEDILSDRVFFAHTVNGVVLPEKHGYPLRVVAEGYNGDDWVKYVYELKVV